MTLSIQTVSETLLHLFQQISPSLSCGNSVTVVRVFCVFIFAILGFWILKRFSLACRLSIFFQIYKENILLDLCGDEWWFFSTLDFLKNFWRVINIWPCMFIFFLSIQRCLYINISDAVKNASVNIYVQMHIWGPVLFLLIYSKVGLVDHMETLFVET